MNGESPGAFSLSCPIPIERYPRVMMAHGGGGRLMHNLIADLFQAAFGAPSEGAGAGHDGAMFPLPAASSGRGAPRLAFTTDSYVVRPLFFRGGDIGTLAINGTVNDLAMCGARPLGLSAGFILEEGLEMETLWRVARSMARAAREAGAAIVTGDTKVVERGKGDGLYINTAGVGAIEPGRDVAPGRIQPGDAVLLNGDVGRHGVAVLSEREGLQFEGAIASDCAPLNGCVEALFAAGVDVHCLRDCTRGGVATTLVELARAARVQVEIEERAIAVEEPVRGACELLGLDPLYVANEGRFIAFVPGAAAERALAALRAHPVSAGAAVIGRVEAASPEAPGGEVRMKSLIGAWRILDMLSGEQLPRIC